MSQRIIVLLSLVWLWNCSSPGLELSNEKGDLPNIVIFYVDDLGYSDLSGYGAVGVETPRVDDLIRNGLMFTDGHSSAATCTPSRYALLTGEYGFRNQARVLPGDAPLLIDTSTATLPKMLQAAGYRTGVVGKWHLGLGDGSVDWNAEVAPGPLEIGFDYSYLLPATGDRVPTVYLENRNVVGLDPDDRPLRVSYSEDLGQIQATMDNSRYYSDPQHSQTLVNGVGRIGAMTGGESAWWTDEEFPDVFTDKALAFIEESKDRPFMLFFSFHDIHVPRLPNERFKGVSAMGPRGDAIVQMDWMTGRIIDHLGKLELEENTLVIFTSDNGPVLNDGYEDQAVEKIGDHRPGGPYRGGKYSAYEAGTRVPFITYWPDKIEPGTSDAVISQVDIYASLAELVHKELKEDEAPDSEKWLDVLLGQTTEGKRLMIEESLTLALRMGKWKYISPIPDTENIPLWVQNKGIESGLAYQAQLYNLEQDPKEESNLASVYPQLVAEMQFKIDSIRTLGGR